MIIYIIACDHPDCTERVGEAETRSGARRIAVAADWKRRVTHDGDLLDVCPAHLDQTVQPP